jgi:hypothetical protein
MDTSFRHAKSNPPETIAAPATVRPFSHRELSPDHAHTTTAAKLLALISTHATNNAVRNLETTQKRYR